MNKKHLFVWGLYDFANSFIFITFLIYFSKWLVVNKGLSDWWYNGLFILGSFGLIIFAPILGIKADRLGKGRKYLAISTFGCALFYAIAVGTAVGDMNVFIPALAFGLGNFFYQLSFVFYNPLLNNLASPEKRSRVSGIGFLYNYAGQICALLISLPLVSGEFSLGVDPLIAPLIPAIILFVVLALPLFFVKTLFAFKALSSGDNITNKIPSQKELIKTIVGIPGVLSFLLAFFLFSDAITTIINNFSIYTNYVLSVSDKTVSILVLSVIVFAAFGAWIWGLLADTYGPRKIITLILIIWMFVIAGFSITASFSVFAVATFFAGLLIGGTWTVSRSLLSSLVPKELLNYAFGLYGISERAATFVGPLVWTMVLAVSNYRIAMFAMVFFQIASVVLILRMKKMSTTAIPLS